MKRTLSILLAALLALSVTACNKEAQTSPSLTTHTADRLEQSDPQADYEAALRAVREAEAYFVDYRHELTVTGGFYGAEKNKIFNDQFSEQHSGDDLYFSGHTRDGRAWELTYVDGVAWVTEAAGKGKATMSLTDAAEKLGYGHPNAVEEMPDRIMERMSAVREGSTMLLTFPLDEEMCRELMAEDLRALGSYGVDLATVAITEGTYWVRLDDQNRVTGVVCIIEFTFDIQTVSHDGYAYTKVAISYDNVEVSLPEDAEEYIDVTDQWKGN